MHASDLCELDGGFLVNIRHMFDVRDVTSDIRTVSAVAVIMKYECLQSACESEAVLLVPHALPALILTMLLIRTLQVVQQHYGTATDAVKHVSLFLRGSAALKCLSAVMRTFSLPFELACAQVITDECASICLSQAVVTLPKTALMRTAKSLGLISGEVEDYVERPSSER